MAKVSILAGATSVSVNIFIQNSSLTTGAGLTGLVYNTANLIAYYALPRAAPVAITLATLASATASFSSGGFFELDATHCPGLYRLDIPDAALASGRFVTIFLSGAANMAQTVLEIELTAWNNQDGVRGGMTALPNAVPGAAGGVFIAGSNAATTVNITGNITGNVSGSIGSVTGAVGSVTGNVGGNVVGSIGSLATQAKADVNAEADAALLDVGLTTTITGRIDVAVSTRLASASYTAPDNTGIAAIKVKTDNLSSDPADASDIAGAFTTVNGTLATIAGYIDTEVTAIYNRIGPPSGASIAADIQTRASPAQVNAEMVDALSVDTYAEPAQGAPVATSSLAAKIGYLFKAFRNKKTQSGTTWKLYADDGTTVDQKQALSDDGSIMTRDEVASGP